MYVVRSRSLRIFTEQCCLFLYLYLSLLIDVLSKCYALFSKMSMFQLHTCKLSLIKNWQSKITRHLKFKFSSFNLMQLNSINWRCYPSMRFVIAFYITLSIYTIFLNYTKLHNACVSNKRNLPTDLHGLTIQRPTSEGLQEQKENTD